jgi:hypothetical protein
MTKTNHEDDISAMLSLAFAVLETGSLPSTMVEDVSKMIGSNPQYSGIGSLYIFLFYAFCVDP